MRSKRGFTIIELMVVVAIIGILIAVAVPAFMSYMKKTKKGEAELQLNKIAKSEKVYFATYSDFSPSATAPMPGTDGGACAAPGGKFAIDTTWPADTGWSTLGFEIDEKNLFTYHYDRFSKSSALATAVGDLDCDGTLITFAMTFSLVSEGVSAILSEPPADAD